MEGDLGVGGQLHFDIVLQNCLVKETDVHRDDKGRSTWQLKHEICVIPG